MNETAVHSAIRQILADKAHYATTLNYAIGYCRAGLEMTGHDLAVQCLYILNNIQSWRHPDARAVRATLRSFRA